MLAAGILGATVMPHVIFLHSALTQKRVVASEPRLLRQLFRYELVDVGLAMSLAGLVNAAMLIMAASTSFAPVSAISQLSRPLTSRSAPLLGKAASWIFAISLLASGLASSAVGTLAGQVIMQGFLHRRIPLWVRRAFTMLPPLLVIALGLDPTRTLVLSQVVLSFGIPFALMPLILFTRRTDLMGALVNRPLTTLLATAVAGMIIALNIFLLYQIVLGG